MLGWISKLFKRKKMKQNGKNDEYSLDGLDPAGLAKVRIRRQFEIYVEEYDEGDVGGRRAGWYPVKNNPELGGQNGNPVITINSQQDLAEKQATFKQLGQRFKIVREINPPTRAQILEAAKQQGVDLKAEDEEQPAETEKTAEGENPAESQRAEHAEKPEKKPEQPAREKRPPKIITVGDIQIKYDGDKVYQKQWMRLTPQEASNFRVVNDSNNKLVSLAGKHIEAKRWTLVENSEQEDDRVEEMINA